ncbi:VanZ like family protein (modular protein) [Candidatus Methylobacter favarea]|uniref:VanZ like family protein (Modular protein) n=1 Tax=Candidatus Methylobacter favarea TaxID=2707345 RepID=A0A8S0Y6T1_9GAMM|nr:VanZ family protein [Candidatus Methylobacter favarea]CAA9892109.1 VanZ like family protein (modular protein) [Candidatus Methylobacter favarea]
MQKTYAIHYHNLRASIIWPLLYMAGIFCLSSIPDDQGIANHTLNPLTWISPNLQNFLHIPFYAVLAWLWLWSLRNWFAKFSYTLILTLILTVGYGFLDEWHQTFVPGRFGSLTDAGFNFIGAIIGVSVYRLMFTKQVDFYGRL